MRQHELGVPALKVFEALTTRAERITALGRGAELALCLAVAERWSGAVDHARPLQLSNDTLWIGGALLAATRSSLWSSLRFQAAIPDISDDELLAAGPVAEDDSRDEWQEIMEVYVALIMRAYQMRRVDLGLERAIPSDITPIESPRTLARVLYDSVGCRVLEASAGMDWQGALTPDEANRVLADAALFQDEITFLDEVYRLLEVGDVDALWRHAAGHRVDGAALFATPLT